MTFRSRRCQVLDAKEARLIEALERRAISNTCPACGAGPGVLTTFIVSDKPYTGPERCPQCRAPLVVTLTIDRGLDEQDVL